MRPILTSTLFILVVSSPVLANPIDDSQALYDVLVGQTDRVAQAIEMPASRSLARALEVEVLDAVISATQAWDRAAMQSGSYRSYNEFRPCLSAGQLLGYVTEEVVQHHLGHDLYEGDMKYRHAGPFGESLEQCANQLLAARAETGSDATQR